ALIHNRPVLGGNASIELGVPVQGASIVKGFARESGICEEMIRLKTHHQFEKLSGSMTVAAAAETNLTVFLNQHVHAVEMQDKTIAGVCAVDTLSGMESCFKGTVFVDCTGDGWLGYYAGADFRMGREAQREYNESLAPTEADERTMSGCLMGKAFGFGWRDAGEPVSYEAPVWAPTFPANPEFGRKVTSMTGTWWLEHRNSVDDVWNGEQARDELIRINFGYWDWLKNRWEKKEQAAHARLKMIPVMSARRESRRLLGDHVLNENDCVAGRMFEDGIGHYGWMLDIHHPEGIYSGEEGPYDFNTHIPLGSIPYRSLYSRNIENLLMAGRCMSVSHVALGTVRVEGQCMVTGQAAGTAAALVARHETTSRGIYENHLKELQQTLLRHDQYIPGLRNEDPDDLARTAKADATSFAPCDLMNEAAYTVDPVGRHRTLQIPLRSYFQNGEQEYIGSLKVHLYSLLEKPTEVKVLLLEARHPRDEATARNPVPLAEATAVIEPTFEGYVEFKFDVPVKTPYFALYFEKAKGIYVSAARRGFPLRPGGDGLVKEVKPRLMVAAEPPLRLTRDYRPEQAIGGVGRHAGGEANMWRSDPDQLLPQSLSLQWNEPQAFNTVQLTLDTNLDGWKVRAPFEPETISDYSVQIHDGSQWKTVVEERDNFLRHRIHRFPAVKANRLRLVVHKTHGDPSARVYEIRVYNQ
ncbi:MAG: FAD-dependent oxidoreductase, partial [Verrucomicrobiota bacterium]|nr:FAD-dependent oxidoreductase [Verrucomicrobiota bacterium]